MKDNKYIKIAVVVAAVLLVSVILVVALTRDNDKYSGTDENYSTPTQTEQTTPEETTNNAFDDSNIGEWIS